MDILSVVHSKISRGRKRIDFFYRALAFFLISTLVLTVVPSSQRSWVKGSHLYRLTENVVTRFIEPNKLGNYNSIAQYL